MKELEWRKGARRGSKGGCGHLQTSREQVREVSGSLHAAHKRAFSINYCFSGVGTKRRS